MYNQPVQDMIPPKRDRSIRNIPVSAGHRRPNAPPPAETHHKEVTRPKYPQRSRVYLWWGGGVVLVCAVIGLLLSTVFEGADITVTPKVQAVTPPTTLEAEQNASLGALVYQTMTVKQSASTTVTASGTQHVSKTATGVVTIYNNYSAASQTLITNTRFETPKGTIYRIHTSVVVPGQVKGQSGSLTPGSVTAIVYADTAGAAGNLSGAMRFTIPGFKNDPRYDKFYAESQGAIVGGFVGDQPVVSKTDMTKAEATLKMQLDTGISAAAGASTPKDFLLVAGTLSTTYSDIAQTQGSGRSVSLSQTATGRAAIVPSSDLAAAIAKAVVSGYKGEPVAFIDASTITVAAATTGKVLAGPLVLTLSGTPTLVWQLDAEVIKQALLGKEKSTFEDIIKTFRPGAPKASASVRPFWLSSFPSDPAKLTVTIESK